MFSGKVAGMDGHLLERLDRRLHLIDSNHQAVVVRLHPLDADLESVQGRSTDLEGAVRRNVPTGNECDERVRIAYAGGREVAARAEVQRQRVEILARHARRNFGALRVQHGRIGDDVHLFGKIPELQLRVNLRGLTDEDADAFLPKTAEALDLDVQVVSAHRHLRRACSCRSAW